MMHDQPFMASSLAQTAGGVVIAFASAFDKTVPQWIIALAAVANVAIHLVSAYKHWKRRDDEESDS